MKILKAFLLVSVAVWAHAQTDPKPEVPQSHLSIATFGLAYPLSNDWVRATEMLQKRLESSDAAPNYDLLLAAVYVPKSSLSASSPFFSLRAYRQPATNCKQNLEAMIAHSQGKKEQAQTGVQEFSAAGRDYFRVDLPHGIGGRHESVICTTAKDHLLVWDAGASNDKGMDAIVATLGAITPLPQQTPAESAPSAEQKEEHVDDVAPKPVPAQPERVRVSSGVSTGLLIKKVSPVYPLDARQAYIQGTVVLKAEISKDGDIADLELVDGPIELAGSAVAAVRQWKYKPYLLMGRPVTVFTTIQVNYQLRP